MLQAPGKGKSSNAAIAGTMSIVLALAAAWMFLPAGRAAPMQADDATEDIVRFSDAVAAVARAAGMTRTVPDQPRAEELSIVSARYGADESWIDVTEQLASAVKNGRVAIQAGNSIAGDPVFGKPKVLHVDCVLNGQRQSLSAREGQTLYIPPIAGRNFAFEVISNEDRLVSLAAACPAEIGFFGKNLVTGRTIAYQADQPACLASIVKLFVLLEVMRRDEAGTLDLKEKIDFARSEGTVTCTISEALDLMIGLSDNGATNALAALVGYDRVNALPAQLGIEGLSEKIMPEPGVLASVLDERVKGPRLLPENKLLPQHGTARAMVRYFELLHDGKLLDSPTSGRVLEVLNRNPKLFAPNATPVDCRSVGKGGSLVWIRPPRPRYEMVGWALYIYGEDTAVAFCFWGEWFPGAMTAEQRWEWCGGLSDAIVNLLLQGEQQPERQDDPESAGDVGNDG